MEKKRGKCTYCHKKRNLENMYKLYISFTRDERNICKECFVSINVTHTISTMSPQGDYERHEIKFISEALK